MILKIIGVFIFVFLHTINFGYYKMGNVVYVKNLYMKDIYLTVGLIIETILITYILNHWQWLTGGISIK